MNPINVANCCYPSTEHLTYTVNADLLLAEGAQVLGYTVSIIVSPNQNIEMECARLFATQFPLAIFRITFNSIIRV